MTNKLLAAWNGLAFGLAQNEMGKSTIFSSFLLSRNDDQTKAPSTVIHDAQWEGKICVLFNCNITNSQRSEMNEFFKEHPTIEFG